MKKSRRKPPRIWWEFDGKHWSVNGEVYSKFTVTFECDGSPEPAAIKTWESTLRRIGRAVDERVEPLIVEIAKAFEEERASQHQAVEAKQT